MAIITAPAPLPTSASAALKATAPEVKQPHSIVSPEKPTEETTPDPMAAFHAQMARKEKALRQTQRAFEEEKKAMAQELETLRAKAARAEALEGKFGKLKQDPYGLMLEEGLTSDQVASLMLNQPNPADQRVLLLEKEIQALKAANEQSQSNKQNEQVAQREAAKKQILHDVTLRVDGDQSFEAINAYGESAKSAVVDLIEAVFDSEGYVMDIEEAIKQVEDELVERSYKAAQLGKVKSRLMPAPSVETAPTEKKLGTLSSAMVPSAAKSMTQAEKRARAIAIMQGQKIG